MLYKIIVLHSLQLPGAKKAEVALLSTALRVGKSSDASAASAALETIARINPQLACRLRSFPASELAFLQSPVDGSRPPAAKRQRRSKSGDSCPIGSGMNQIRQSSRQRREARDSSGQSFDRMGVVGGQISGDTRLYPQPSKRAKLKAKKEYLKERCICILSGL